MNLTATGELKINSNIAYIAAGSNKEDRLGYLQKAVNLLRGNSLCSIEALSSVYETKPFGYTEQDNFLNMVIKVSTSLSLMELFHFIKEVEEKTGREKTFRWGPREIDLDLLLYNDEVYSGTELTVPHKGIAERDFVLVPLTGLSPELIHPVLNKKFSDICSENKANNIIRKLNEKVS